MDLSKCKPLNTSNFTQSKRSLYRTLSVPSISNSYAQAIQFARDWFLSKFKPETFKSIFIEGRYALEEQRMDGAGSKMIIRDKPALAIVPGINLDYTNENVDMYQYGVDMYSPQGILNRSFLKDRKNNVYMGIDMQVLQLPFTFRLRVETRSQQIDFYKFIQLAHRVGNTCGEDVDLDFHRPYPLMIQLAVDLGFDVDFGSDNKVYPKIKNLTEFLSYLNTHSALPFVYKYRGLNGKNEFFLRIQRAYVHIKVDSMSNDDGERKGHLMDNFGIELQTEIRFPAPKFYAYYSDNEHKIDTVYTAFRQPQGLATAFYTFKGVPLPKENSRGWDRMLETTYEDDREDWKDHNLSIDFKELLMQGDLGLTIESTLRQGISPEIFIELKLINGGETLQGTMDWESLVYTCDHHPRSQGTYIGLYVDKEYINQYILLSRDGQTNRIQPSKHPNSREEQARRYQGDNFIPAGPDKGFTVTPQ